MQMSKPRAVVSVLLAAALVFGMVLLMAVIGASAANAESETIHKSYVCKYVGTPGVDERLQTGQNPIWVDNHSLDPQDEDGLVAVGDTFADAQGRSIVIVANTAKLDPEPTIDDCPAPDVPPVDVCPNIEGDQAEVPEGYEVDADGNCVIPEPPCEETGTCPTPPPTTPPTVPPHKPPHEPPGDCDANCNPQHGPAAFTGFDSADLGLLALALAGIGGTALWYARRRRV